MWTSRKIGRKRVALLRFFARVGIVQTCSEGAIAQVPTALCGALDRKNVQLRQIDVVDEGQSRAHFTFHARGSRGDALAHEVIAQCDGTKIVLLLPICRDVEVVTAFGTEVFIATQHEKSTDGVAHEAFFERRSAKSLAVTCAISESTLAIACRHLGGEVLVLPL